MSWYLTYDRTGPIGGDLVQIKLAELEQDPTIEGRNRRGSSSPTGTSAVIAGMRPRCVRLVPPGEPTRNIHADQLRPKFYD